ncbi:RecA-like DNA recombinase [Gordonia phage Jamzy]|nr:RecA-like DNA recombinase [Gordonia phage Jamzy]
MMATRATTTKDYAAIAAFKIVKPSQKKPKPPSILVYGRNKKGKTRFACTAPNVLILDPEDGTDEFRKLDPDVWPITRWEDIDEVWRFLRAGDHSYRYVAFDGMTRFSNMALRFVMEQAEETDLSRKPGLVQQRDYGKSGELVKGMLYNFRALPVGCIYTAQERLEEAGDDTEEDDDVSGAALRSVPDLPKGVRSAVNSIVDVIGRIYTMQTDDEPPKVQRRLWLAPSAIYDTGYRSEYVLPQYLTTPTVPRLIRAIRTGNPAATKKEQ